MLQSLSHSPPKKSASKPPFLLRYRSSRWLILSTVSIAVFTDIFLYSLIVPVIPFALTTKAGVAPDQVQYYVSVLLASYGAALLGASRKSYSRRRRQRREEQGLGLLMTGVAFCGYFADHSSSRRLPMMLGLLALAGSTVMLTVGNSIGILITGRILQGISAAVVWIVGLALLVDTVGSKNVGQAMGYVGMSMSLAILAGPLLGGVVYAQGGYYSVFAMAFGLIAMDVLLRAVMIEKKVAVKWSTTNGHGANEEDLVPVAVAVDAVNEKHPPRQQPIEGSAVHTLSALHRRSLTEHPTSRSKTLVHRLPPVITLLASRRLLSALWGVLVVATLSTSFESVLPLFVEHTFSWDSTGAGLIFLPIEIPSFLSPLIGFLSDRYGPRWLATSGFLLACPIFICLRFVTHNSIQQKVLLCALLALAGTALALVFSPLMAEITYVVEAKGRRRPGLFGKSGAYAQAYGLFNMAWAGGTLVGPIWAGLVTEKAGWGTMAWSLGLLSAVTAVPTLMWAGGFIGRQEGKWQEKDDGVDV